MRSWVKLLFVVYLLHPCEAQGLSAETVFVQKGHDVLLDVTDAEGVGEFIVLTWRFNGNVNLVTLVAGQKEIVSQNYTKRIEFFAKNYSVVLKNLQEEDSGDYVAQVIKTSKQEEVAEHKVIVKDPVSPVVLTGHSVSRSSDSCSFTVTCTTRDSHINSTFRCDGQTCSQEGGERTEVPVSGASLQVHLSNDSIICNHSNQVSWTEDSILIELVCAQPDGPQPNPFIVLVVVCILFPILILFVAFLYYARKRKYRRESLENTVWEIPQVRLLATIHLSKPAAEACAVCLYAAYVSFACVFLFALLEKEVKFYNTAKLPFTPDQRTLSSLHLLPDHSCVFFCLCFRLLAHTS